MTVPLVGRTHVSNQHRTAHTCSSRAGLSDASGHAARGSWRLRQPHAVRHRRQRCCMQIAQAGPMRVMIMGAPAAGKGTQCEKIVQKHNLVHISVGDLLRAEVAAGTPAGKQAREYMESGRLVPNEVVVDMVKNRLAQPDAVESGWLLDGYPRSAEQAEAIEQASIRPDLFLLINVPDELLVERIVGRRSDPETGAIYHLTFRPPPEDVVHRLVQRSDDTEEMVRRLACVTAVNRLQTYHNNVNSVLDFYRDILVEVDGTRDMDSVFVDIEAALDSIPAPQQAATV